MPAVSRAKVRIATGFEGAHVERGMAKVAIKAGDPVNIAADEVSTLYDFAVDKVSGAATYCDGIALHDAQPNRKVEILRRGEVEGYAGMTPGTSLSIANGDIDSTAPAGMPFLRVSTPSRITKLF